MADYLVQTPPLPYTVRIRMSVHEDEQAIVSEHHVVAYSLTEALQMAGMIVAGNTAIDEATIVVESVSADVEAYLKMIRAAGG